MFHETKLFRQRNAEKANWRWWDLNSRPSSCQADVKTTRTFIQLCSNFPICPTVGEGSREYTKIDFLKNMSSVCMCQWHCNLEWLFYLFHVMVDHSWLSFFGFLQTNWEETRNKIRFNECAGTLNCIKDLLVVWIFKQRFCVPYIFFLIW